MTPKYHNPGHPIQLELGDEKISAFSISALATYAMLPGINTLFDLGECPLEAVPLEHVFISHAHGDHARCLLRHESLRRLFGMEPATYYIPKETEEGFQELARAWKTLERINPKHFEPPQFRGLEPGDVVWLHRQLAAKPFRVDHTLPSLGYTLFDVRKKLKEEFHGRSGRELAALRKEGVVFEDEKWLPRVTFIGDSTIETFYRERHIGESKILFIEVTFLMDEERETARRRGHTHLADLIELLQDSPDYFQNEHIVLKHFSMRYDRRFIINTLQSQLPADFLARAHFLI